MRMMTKSPNACFVSLSFAGLVVLARSLNPIPSRTRPLNSSAPMVLWLKPWESRSLPGLPRTKQFLFTCHDQTERRFPSGRRRFCLSDHVFVCANTLLCLHGCARSGTKRGETAFCVGLQRRFHVDRKRKIRVQDLFISKFV